MKNELLNIVFFSKYHLKLGRPLLINHLMMIVFMNVLFEM
jgi:hypothetical protein